MFKKLKSWLTNFTMAENGTKSITNTPLIHDLEVPEEEIYNLVTYYGQYPEMWLTYRHHGLVEAIKRRDDKIEFDRQLSGYALDNARLLNQPSKPITNESSIFFKPPIQESSSKILSELDIALVKGVATYFGNMTGKILYYHQDHKATREEAEIIARYYAQMQDALIQAKTIEQLSQAIQSIENLKKMVNRYQHNELKYSWSYCLEVKVLQKLKSIL